MFWTTKKRILGALAVAVPLGGCDILEVRDPGRYDSEDLDDALEAVANTVEGSAHGWADYYVLWQSLLSDVFQYTGWNYAFYTQTWGLIDEGRINYDTYPTSGTNWGAYSRNNFPDGMSQHSWFADRSWQRLVDNLPGGEEEAMSSTMGAQVLLGTALLDMYAGLFSCEAVLDPSPSPMRADVQVYERAAETFGRLMEVALSIDPETLEESTVDFLNAGRTGRALMLMLSGDYEGAASEAAAVPDDFSYDAIKDAGIWLQRNNVNYYGNGLRFTGLMKWLWDRIDLTFGTHSYIRDRWTNEHDTRMPVWYRGWTGTDYETQHYGQWKYPDRGTNIPMLHSDHARLIEAEAKVMNDDFAGATAILNNLRSRVGLSAVDVPTTMDGMMDFLLEERFAELFMEGHRAVDLYRFDLTEEVFREIDDPFRPAQGRASKFPGSSREAWLNPEVEDEPNLRCAPVG